MKIELKTSPKFKRLCRVMDLRGPQVAGLLEYLWHVGYEQANEVIGDSIDVEAASEWWGGAGAWTKALVDGGWLDDIGGGKYAIHDFWDHAPQFVERKAKRKTSHSDRMASHRQPVGDMVASQRLASGAENVNGGDIYHGTARHGTARPPAGTPASQPASAGNAVAEAFAELEHRPDVNLPAEIEPPQPLPPVPADHVAVIEDAIGRPIDAQRGEPAIVRNLARLCATSPPALVAEFVRKGMEKCGSRGLSRVNAYVHGCTVMGPKGPMLEAVERANSPPRAKAIPRAATVARLDV